MPSSGVHERGLPETDEPLGRGRAELRDPEVVRVEARALVLGLGVVAEQHPDRRVDHLRDHAVGVLVRETRDGIPAAAPQLLESLAAVEPHLFGRTARRGDEPERHQALAVVDEHDVAEYVVVVQARRAVAERGIDAVEVGARRLRHV